MIFKAALLKIQ